MTAISAIRDGLKTRLETIAGVRVFDEIPSVVTGSATAAVVQYTGTAYDSTMARGSDDLTFTVVVLVPKTSDRAAKERLDGFLDTTGAASVKAAVDSNLGGAVSFARVAAAGGYAEYQVDSGSYLGVEFTIEVTT